MTISAALKRVYASAPTNVRYVETLSFSHSQFANAHYFTNDLRDWTFNLETGASQVFTSIPFKLQLPNNDKNGNQDLQIVISNIGAVMMSELEAANSLPTEPIVCTFRVYLNTTGSSPQNTPVLQMTITDVEAKKDTISAVARRADILNKPFPSESYTFDKFPGLNR